MVALVLPVGHFAGPMFIAPDAEAPASFEIRFRDGVFSLSAPEYAVWAVAHGDPEKVGRQRPSRTVVESAAKAAGVDDPGPIFDELINDGLLVQVMPKGESAREFAKQHQVMPLALGLGNTPQQLGAFQIGMPNAPRATVGYDVYHMWLFCHREDNLWKAITTIAKEAEEANAEETRRIGGEALGAASGVGTETATETATETEADRIELISDPDVLLTGLLEALPVLVSTSCIYIDRRS